QTSIPYETTLDQAPVGGLSGMIKLQDEAYLAISDDRSELAPARMIKLKISFKNGELKVLPLSNVTLKKDSIPFAFNEIDTEAIARLGQDVLIASEGSYRKGQRHAPFIRRFDLEGNQLSEIPLDSKFIPQASGEITRGVRSNKGFESLATTADGKLIFAATETALIQDAKDDLQRHNLVRILRIEADSFKTQEFAIKLDHIQVDGAGGVLTGDNGLSDILVLNENELLLLERAWVKKIK